MHDIEAQEQADGEGMKWLAPKILCSWICPIYLKPLLGGPGDLISRL